ncbi:Magnesium-dependent phosphatase 1, partial [Durusdinium trenchii]
AILVDTAPGASSVEKLAGVLYTAFFSLSAAAFLCTCQHWLRLFDSMDLSQDGEALVESPWSDTCPKKQKTQKIKQVLTLEVPKSAAIGLPSFPLSGRIT